MIALRAALTVALLAAPCVANAQRLFGNVVLADERTPGSGAVITVLDSSGRVVTRELASGRGDYVIPLERPGRFTLVAQRVGSLPDTIRDVEVAAARDLRTRIVLSRNAPRPAQVAQRSRPVCALASDTTGLAALWAQFQVALTSTEIAESSKAFVADWSVSERVLSANLRDTVTRSESSERLPIDMSVLASIRPDSSERLGFVIESGEGVLYFVPGLNTFRSPRFQAQRCFAFEPAPEAQPGWIGLHFWNPTSRLGISEIEGTVWFDATTLEPRALTFIFAGLPPSFAAARSGGGIRFLRLQTGHWIADEWTIRVPSGRYQRMFAYDVSDRPTGYGNVRLDGVRIRTARLAELSVNGTTIVRKP